jgi:hypothetical protein
MTNTAACKILRMTRRTGSRIRARYRQQTAAPARPAAKPGRYLTLRERLQSADLLRLAARCALSHSSWAAAPRRSNASWTATATNMAVTCPRPPITPHANNAAGPASTSCWPTRGCAN